MKKLMMRILVVNLVVFSILGIGVFIDSKKETEEMQTINVVEAQENDEIVVCGEVSVNDDNEVEVIDNKIFYKGNEITEDDWNNMTAEQQYQIKLAADIH